SGAAEPSVGAYEQRWLHFRDVQPGAEEDGEQPAIAAAGRRPPRASGAGRFDVAECRGSPETDEWVLASCAPSDLTAWRRSITAERDGRSRRRAEPPCRDQLVELGCGQRGCGSRMRHARKPQSLAAGGRPGSPGRWGAYLARDSHCAWLGARRERGGRGTGTAMPDDHARAGTRSEGTEKRDELLLLVGAELGEAIARGAPLAVVRENRVLDSGRSPVV